jgi:hypothetical protein
MAKDIMLWTKQTELMPKAKNGKFRYYINGTQLMDPNGGDVNIIPTESLVKYYGGPKHTPYRILKKAKLVRYEDDPHPAPWGNGTANWTAYYEGNLVTELFQSFLNILGNPFNSKVSVGYRNQYAETFIRNMFILK